MKISNNMPPSSTALTLRALPPPADREYRCTRRARAFWVGLFAIGFGIGSIFLCRYMADEAKKDDTLETNEQIGVMVYFMGAVVGLLCGVLSCAAACDCLPDNEPIPSNNPPQRVTHPPGAMLISVDPPSLPSEEKKAVSIAINASTAQSSTPRL